MNTKMKIGQKIFDFSGHTYVMGILNVTPDSFSDGGRYTQTDLALKHAEQMINEGAAIIDVGGESTRPGYEKITIAEETRRVTKMIAAIKKEFSIPVSIDTYKSPVAKEAFEAGADLLNDVWGLRYEVAGPAHEEAEEIKKAGTMAEVAKKYDVPVCIMHNRMEPVYTSFISDVIQDLQESISLAEAAGISREKLILDPGIGFGKTYEMNLHMMNHLEVLKVFDLPILLGTSRKSMIGITLDLPVTQREEGTLVTTVMAVQKGCQFVRVHDVEKNIRAIKMAETILKN